jgi:hypothetical protein
MPSAHLTPDGSRLSCASQHRWGLKLCATRREAFRIKLATLLEHRLFYIPSFKIYGARRLQQCLHTAPAQC